MTPIPQKHNKQQAAEQKVQQHTQVAITQHIGPIPDPVTLEKYNQIQPGFAERIVAMAEKEQANRHNNENLRLLNQDIQHKRDTNTFRIGQFLGIFGVSCIVGLCVYGFSLGYSTQTATIASTVIVGLAASFAVNKFKSKN